jgi:hypothetical protein
VQREDGRTLDGRVCLVPALRVATFALSWLCVCGAHKHECTGDLGCCVGTPVGHYPLLDALNPGQQAHEHL